MKKNFKKSKFVILPALATLVLTGVASVTGTVAWFTANRVATVSGGKFQTGTNDGNLIVTLSDGKGVDLTNTDKSPTQTITVADNVTLLDASYSGTSLNDENGTPFWTDVQNGSEKYQAVPQQYATNSNYWYGLSWKMTFSVDVSNTSSNYDIFFDVSGSSAKDESNTTGNTKTGFRTYMKSGNNDAIVWAPFSSQEQVNGDYNAESKADRSKLGYVSSVTDTTQYTIASTTTHGLISTDNKTLSSAALDKGAENVKRGDWLGTCSISGTTKAATLDVQVVVWFDGLDANMVSSNLDKISTVSTTMKFYAREHADNN